MKPQTSDVLELLRRCGPAGVTDGIARDDLGCSNAAARIHELRGDGYAIETRYVSVPTRHGPARVARYILDEKGCPSCGALGSTGHWVFCVQRVVPVASAPGELMELWGK